MAKDKTLKKETKKRKKVKKERVVF